MIVAFFVEVKEDSEICRVEKALHDGGFAFITKKSFHYFASSANNTQETLEGIDKEFASESTLTFE